MTTLDNRGLTLLTHLSQSLAITIALAEYEFNSCNDNLVDRYHIWYDRALTEVKIIPDQGVCNIYQMLDTYSKFEISRVDKADVLETSDIELIYERFIANRIISRFHRVEEPSFTLLVSNVLSTDEAGYSLKQHRNREAYDFIVNTTLLFLSRVRDKRYKSMRDALRFLNGLSNSPYFSFY